MGKTSWVREEMERLEREKTGERGEKRSHRQTYSKQAGRRLQDEETETEIDLDTKFHSIASLSEETGISKPDIRRMIKEGSLKKIMLPGRKTPVFSKQNLIGAIANHNKTFK